MKIELFSWAGEPRVKAALESFGYEHRQIVNGELHDLIQTFLDKKINVMILHGQQGVCDYVLALDTVSFYQR